MVHVDFYLDLAEGLLLFRDQLVQVVLIVLHHHIQILLLLAIVLFDCVVSEQDVQDKVIIEHLQDLQLSVFIFSILEDFLHCD